MTNNTKTTLSKLISQIHDNKKIWELSSFYNYCSSKGYSRSKRTFERELADLDFYPKVQFDKDDESLKKIIFRTWEDICSSKRYLSLKSSISIFDNNLYIFFEDGRGKKYWLGVSKLSKEILISSFKALYNVVNKSFVIWPSKDLLNLYQAIVEDIGTEAINITDNSKVILPVSSFKKILTNHNLVQANNYKCSSSEISNENLTHLEKIEAEAIFIIRETCAEAENPVMLYSVGKDSAVMLHLAKKPFILLLHHFP